MSPHRGKKKISRPKTYNILFPHERRNLSETITNTIPLPSKTQQNFKSITINLQVIVTVLIFLFNSLLSNTPSWCSHHQRKTTQTTPQTWELHHLQLLMLDVAVKYTRYKDTKLIIWTNNHHTFLLVRGM